MPAQHEVLHVISDQARRGAQTFAVQLVSELNRASSLPRSRLVALEPSSGVIWPVEALGSTARSPETLRTLRREFNGASVVVAHGSTTLAACAVAGVDKPTQWIYRNIGDPTVWGSVRGAQVRIGLPLRRAAGVTALYEGAREYLIDRYRLHPDKVVMVPNAVPLFSLPSRHDREQARRSLGLTADLRWVSFVGSLTEEKGILHAIQAIAVDNDLGLLVAGDGVQRDEATELAERVAPRRVRFLGVTDKPLQVMAATEALILPSRTEGLPGVAIEAGLSGLPVVATKVGGIPELVLDGVTGVLVDQPAPDELVAGMRVAMNNAARMGTAARDHCQTNYTMERVAEQWGELLRRVVEMQS